MPSLTCQTCPSTFAKGRGRPALCCATCRANGIKIPAPPPTFTISITCPLCESPVQAINQRSVKGELVALVKCQGLQPCGHEFLVRAFVAPAMRGLDGHASRCGTEAGYMRHRRADQDPCVDCLRAHVERHKDRKQMRKNKETAA